MPPAALLRFVAAALRAARPGWDLALKGFSRPVATLSLLKLRGP